MQQDDGARNEGGRKVVPGLVAALTQAHRALQAALGHSLFELRELQQLYVIGKGDTGAALAAMDRLRKRLELVGRQAATLTADSLRVRDLACGEGE